MGDIIEASEDNEETDPRAKNPLFYNKDIKPVLTQKYGNKKPTMKIDVSSSSEETRVQAIVEGQESFVECNSDRRSCVVVGDRLLNRFIVLSPSETAKKRLLQIQTNPLSEKAASWIR